METFIVLVRFVCQIGGDIIANEIIAYLPIPSSLDSREIGHDVDSTIGRGNEPIMAF